MSTPPTMDPLRLSVAAHEVGHLVVWQAAGLDIENIRVQGYGTQAHGFVSLGPNGRNCQTRTHAYGYLVGLLAGREAALKWCELHDLQHRDYTCETDMSEYRRNRTHPWTADVPDKEFRAEARHAVRVHWTRITHLAPQLCQRGYIAV